MHAVCEPTLNYVPLLLTFEGFQLFPDARIETEVLHQFNVQIGRAHV